MPPGGGGDGKDRNLLLIVSLFQFKVNKKKILGDNFG